MANQLSSFSSASVTPTKMSSREIADLIEKQHNHIKVSSERLAEKGVIGTPATREFTHNGNIYIEYLFSKRDSLILVAQNCPEFTARIVDRWQELEAQQAAPQFDPTKLTTMQILEMAMKSESERLALEAKVEVMAPKVAALDRIETADGMLNLQSAGKVLQQQPNKFTQWLREHGWIYKRAGSNHNSARAEKFNAGYLATKTYTVMHPDGVERVREQVMVTPKGLTKLAGIFSMPTSNF